MFPQHSREVAEARGGLIAGLEVTLGKVDATTVQAAWGSGFESLNGEAECSKTIG